MPIFNLHTPPGNLKIEIEGGKIVLLEFRDKNQDTSKSATQEDKRIFWLCKKQMEEYFKGTRTNFDLPFIAQGTFFQEKIWKELQNIPYGATISYKELAKRIGNPKSVRAVGTANGRNPISIIIPCHRVIGSDGSLTGYGGGIDKKRWLLEHEIKWAQKPGLLF